MFINHLFLGLLENTHAVIQIFGMVVGGGFDYTDEQGTWCFIFIADDCCNTVCSGGEGCCFSRMFDTSVHFFFFCFDVEFL